MKMAMRPLEALVEEEQQQSHEADEVAAETAQETDDDNVKSPREQSVSLQGGPPWGFVFEGGSEFNCALIVAYVIYFDLICCYRILIIFFINKNMNQQIQPDSVAARSGVLNVGDQIVGVGDQRTNNCHALTLDLIRSTPPGSVLTLLLERRYVSSLILFIFSLSPLFPTPILPPTNLFYNTPDSN